MKQRNRMGTCLTCILSTNTYGQDNQQYLSHLSNMSYRYLAELGIQELLCSLAVPTGRIGFKNDCEASFFNPSSTDIKYEISLTDDCMYFDSISIGYEASCDGVAT